MTTTHGVAAYPLYWPLDHKRTTSRRGAPFQVDFPTARAQLIAELRRLRATDIVISTNIPLRRDGLPMVPDREPDDPGVAVYFMRGQKPYVIACDHFNRIRWNLRAIGLTIRALRSIERHATTSMLEQAFSGFAALPAARAADAPWRTVLGFNGEPVSAEAIRARYRELARTHHPDVGGDDATMAAINRAYQAALEEMGAQP